jgi:hypothetical protein
VAGLAAKQNLIYRAAYAANEALSAALKPEYVLHDPQYGSFDPFWEETAKHDLLVLDEHPLRLSGPREEAPDWSRWVGADLADVIYEEPATGERATWFEKGRFNQPESHGKWPKNAVWNRRVLEDVERDIHYDNDVVRVKLKFSIDTNGHPCSAYIKFPFLNSPDDVLVDVGGAWADPRKENIPGSCVNWWTAHNGVLLAGDSASFLWTSWDAPLVMFDEICPNPPKERNDLSTPTLISWAFHNYWGTNFAATHHGEVQFRYRIKYWPYRVSMASVAEYLAGDPLPEYPKAALRKL